MRHGAHNFTYPTQKAPKRPPGWTPKYVPMRNLGQNNRPSPMEDYSSEARQAPTSNDDALVFSWGEDCYQVQEGFKRKWPGGRVTEGMLNALFEDIHCMDLYSPEFPDPLKYLGFASLFLGIVMLFVLMFSGLLSSYYYYEIKQDEEKRYLHKITNNGRTAEYILTGLGCLALGGSIAFLFWTESHSRENSRLDKRTLQIEKILRKHETTTFASTNCTLQCSKLGANIFIKPRPVVDEASGQPAVEQQVPVPQTSTPEQPALAAHPAVELKSLGQAEDGKDWEMQAALPEKTEVPIVPQVKDHPEDVSIQVPEEQPL